MSVDSRVPELDSGMPRVDAAPDGVVVAPECVEVCGTRDEAGPMGFCELERMPDGGVCEERCAALLEASLETRDAFAECVENDPLCFQTLDDCLYRVRYPTAVVLEATLRGVGLDAHDGQRVQGWLRVDADLVPLSTRIEGGRFELTWNEAMRPADSTLVLVHVDVDGDGRCDPDADLTASITLERSGTFDEPSFGGILEGPPDRPFEFVCRST